MSTRKERIAASRLLGANLDAPTGEGRVRPSWQAETSNGTDLFSRVYGARLAGTDAPYLHRWEHPDWLDISFIIDNASL